MSVGPVSIREVFRIQYLDAHSLVETLDGRFYVFNYDQPESGRLVAYHYWEPSKEYH